MIRYYAEGEPSGWWGFGWRLLVLMMVYGIIAGGIFIGYGQWYGIVLFSFGIISAFVYFENLTRRKDYRNDTNRR